MDMYEQRRNALQRLVDSLGRGGIASIAQKIGKDASYVSRMLYPADKNGSKRIGEDTAVLLQGAFPTFFIGELALLGGGATPFGHEAASSPYEAPAANGEGRDLIITQYDVGGAMGNGGKLILEAEQPGVIKSWRVDQDWLRLNVPTYTSVGNLCIVTGFGPSMKPIFNPGDPLLMDRGVNHVDHEGIYFFRIGDEGFIKIIQRVPNFDKPGFVLRIISKNKDDFPPYDISSKHPDFHVIGKILTVWRSEQY
ncbi:S24 family peptidase [Comamonas sp. E6]|uniref:S24 family peptidase n=1 Tax=unclassified Comamonas TaxID=2638500 RepID=UPI000632E810|nr:S24 family peptidase [Comamonas sp. E6]GAO73352.1 hypothetical protein CSE6_036_47890 [Comamonas sp. E6]